MLFAMRNDDLALCRKQLPAVDTIAAYNNGSCCGRGIRRICLGVSELASGSYGHFVCGAPNETTDDSRCIGGPGRNPTAAIYNRYKVGRAVVDRFRSAA